LDRRLDIGQHVCGGGDDPGAAMTAATYVLMVWMTLGTGQRFATHDFSSLPMCESFGRWLENNQREHKLKAVCVLKWDHEI
jgi:hypothetical protein